MFRFLVDLLGSLVEALPELARDEGLLPVSSFERDFDFAAAAAFTEGSSTKSVGGSSACCFISSLIQAAFCKRTVSVARSAGHSGVAIKACFVCWNQAGGWKVVVMEG